MLNNLPAFDNINFNDRNLPVYSNTDILNQLISRTLLGCFNQSDQRILNEDPLLSEYFSACSQSTVSRFFDRAGNHTNVVFKEILTKMACDHVNQYIKTPIIDADSTLAETYGNQEASAFIHHYGEVGYHPLVINEFHSKILLSSRLRTGSSYSSNSIIEELQTVFTWLYNRGNIRFRGDSAFYDTKLLDFLEENEVTYYIRAKNFNSLKEAARQDMLCKDIDWMEYDHNKPYYGETEYQVGTKSKKVRRILYKACSIEENGQMSLLPTIYAIVTNDEECSPYDGMNFYELRGASENFTKELKNDFDAGHLSHSGFLENEMEWLISSMAYNLFHIFQNKILTDSDQKITMNTFRLRFQKIAVKITSHARKLILSFSSAYSNRRKFMHYRDMVLQI